MMNYKIFWFSKNFLKKGRGTHPYSDESFGSKRPGNTQKAYNLCMHASLPP